MKSGVSLQQMLTEVKRQSESKEDYLIAPNRLRMESYGKEMFLHLSDDSGTELIEPMTITGIYNFRSPEIEAGESMLAANGISFFPYPSRYAVRYEGESPYTAMEFAKQIKNHSLAELLSMQLLPYEILEIDDGIRPYCFLVERLGHVRCIRFKSDIARESKYEESGGKAI